MTTQPRGEPRPMSGGPALAMPSRGARCSRIQPGRGSAFSFEERGRSTCEIELIAPPQMCAPCVRTTRGNVDAGMAHGRAARDDCAEWGCEGSCNQRRLDGLLHNRSARAWRVRGCGRRRRMECVGRSHRRRSLYGRVSRLAERMVRDDIGWRKLWSGFRQVWKPGYGDRACESSHFLIWTSAKT